MRYADEVKDWFADGDVSWTRQNECVEYIVTLGAKGHDYAAEVVAYLVAQLGIKMRDVHQSLRGYAGTKVCDALEGRRQSREHHPAGKAVTLVS